MFNFLSLILCGKTNGDNTHTISPGAVYRYYEGRRRLFNDSKPSRASAVVIQKRRSKNVALRKQVGKDCCMDSNSVSYSVIFFNSVV